MKDEFDKRLCEKYPKIFKNRHGSMNETCMCWGFAHGDGWYDIVESLCSNIQNHVDWKRRQHPELSNDEFDEQHQVVAAQVKEKFGGLRFYVDNSDDYVRGAISVAESMSHRICEDCGDKGHRRAGGWVRTLCDDCNKSSQDLKREFMTSRSARKVEDGNGG
jgi:hypothetical protein